jgi:SAM-dependent methyltransferase
MAHTLKTDKAQFWEGRWAADHFSPKWAHRGISPEIVDALSTGWFRARAPVLDIGCGLGEIAAWFAKQGHETVGFDISPTAVLRAKEMHAPLPPNLEFMALDACRDPLPNRQFRILIDRGCFHTISPGQVGAYTRNIASVASPGARMLLFIKAFRHGNPIGDPRETEMHVDIVSNAYAGKFNVVRHAPTDLTGEVVAQPRRPLPGLVLWLEAPGREANV